MSSMRHTSIWGEDTTISAAVVSLTAGGTDLRHIGQRVVSCGVRGLDGEEVAGGAHVTVQQGLCLQDATDTVH